MTTELLAELQQVLATGGLQAGLGFLNKRLPHRCTAVYRLDHNMLQLVALVDKLDDRDTSALPEVPLADSFCQYVLRDGEFITNDSAADDRLSGSPYKGVVNSYVGLPLARSPGDLFSTFCHYDFFEQAIDDAEYEFLHRAMTLLPAFL